MTDFSLIGELHRAVAQAERKRRLGRWPPWVWRDLPDGVPNGSAWTREFRRIATNDLFSVMTRDLPDGAIHAMIATLPGGSPPAWVEKQKIKDTLFGARWAVECFPPRNRLVDGADAYHLWVLPADAVWPYDLKDAHL